MYSILITSVNFLLCSVLQKFPNCFPVTWGIWFLDSFRARKTDCKGSWRPGKSKLYVVTGNHNLSSKEEKQQEVSLTFIFQIHCQKYSIALKAHIDPGSIKRRQNRFGGLHILYFLEENQILIVSFLLPPHLVDLIGSPGLAPPSAVCWPVAGWTWTNYWIDWSQATLTMTCFWLSFSADLNFK